MLEQYSSLSITLEVFTYSILPHEAEIISSSKAMLIWLREGTKALCVSFPCIDEFIEWRISLIMIADLFNPLWQEI